MTRTRVALIAAVCAQLRTRPSFAELGLLIVKRYNCLRIVRSRALSQRPYRLCRIRAPPYAPPCCRAGSVGSLRITPVQRFSVNRLPCYRTVQATFATLAGTAHTQQVSAAIKPQVRAFQCVSSKSAVCPHRCHLQSRAQHGSCTYFTGCPRRAAYAKAIRTVHDRSASVAVAAQHSGHASASAIPRILSPQQARAQLLQSTTLESFKIAGVSFEGRQELVRQLKAGTRGSHAIPAQLVFLCAKPLHKLMHSKLLEQ